MKLKIIKENIAEAKLDLNKFKRDFKSTLDLEQSVKRNIRIVEGKGVTNEMCCRLLVLGFDWSAFFKNINKIHKDCVTFKIHMAELDSFEHYLPSSISEDGSVYTLKKEPFKTGVIIIQDALPNPNFCIDNFLKNNIFVYSDKNKYRLEVNV